MTITELCAAIGPENIKIQNIVTSSDQIDYSKKKGGCTMRFFTDQISAADLMSGKHKNIGLVLWFDREKYEQVLQDGMESQ